MGEKIGASVKGGETFALSGNLGAGKTTFVQGFAKGLGIKTKIVSPTFILMRSYQSKKLNFYHVDLYRLEKEVETETQNLGLTDVWNREGSVVVIEWAEKISNILPQDTTWIKFDNTGEETRKIEIEK